MCECEINHHVKPMSQKEKDEDDDGNEREWDAHTEKYRNAWLEMFEEVSGYNSTEGEMFKSRWVKENHDRLCCVNRHRNIDHVWED